MLDLEVSAVSVDEAEPEAPAQPQGMDEPGFRGERKNSRNETTKKMNGSPTTR